MIPPHNMRTDKAENFYFSEYAKVIFPLIETKKSILDVGCQFGRFTIPAYEAGAEITATDIHPRFFKYINKKIPGNSIQFRLEDIDQTCKSLPENSFDIVLCLELLYNLPDSQKKITDLTKLVKPGGLFITSHRSLGYYLFRFIKERKFDEAEKIIQANHPYYNAQTASELKHIYHNNNLILNSLTPIGMFSGFGNDPFSSIINPKRANNMAKQQLNQFESNEKLFDLFGESARYWLVVASKITK